MMKRFLSVILSLCMALSLCLPALATDVVLSPQNLTVDGKSVTCEKYNIGGANYFKLRDLAQALSGTSSQFEVGWDGATGTVSITTGKAYTSVGGELSAGADKSSTAQVSKQTIQINGVTRSDLSAYNIGGANFFKLRDLGTALGFDVDFDSASNTAVVRSGGDAEVASARALGIVPASLGQTVTFAQFAEMLGNVVRLSDSSALDAWNSIAATALKTNSVMERDDGMLALYEAACVLGMGADATAYWLQANAAYDEARLHEGYSPREDIFSNCKQTSPFEANVGQSGDRDYLGAAHTYVMGESSPLNTDPFFVQRSAAVKYSDALTGTEAIKAAYRLYLAYTAKHAGSFAVTDFATDWSDPLLADAKAAKDAILNSKTAITKGSTFVQGATYTGTAYYVSNSGNDSNDGKSPTTAWATAKKVTSATLNSGDAVFFERGGIWYMGEDELRMQTGVTYSAYGTGFKPVWTGSVSGAGNSANWTYYGSTADGGKIWKYKDALEDSGIILLNGSIAARKAYPLWNGSRYVTRAGSAFSVESGLSADLMFFSAVDLTGFSLPAEPWKSGPTGPLYFRCDKGNPGDVFDSIEFSVATDMVTTADGGYNTIDNICARCFPGGGLDCNSHDNIIFQNCESCWNGGGVQSYTDSGHGIVVGYSGGGMLLFGSNVTGRNNYLHDCESKGIAVVINGSSHASLERINVLAEGNVVERCGSGIYMMVEFIPAGGKVRFENIRLQNNWFINSGYGWCSYTDVWDGTALGSLGEHQEAMTINNITPTGEVRIANNLFYRSTGPMISYYGKDFSSDAKVPTMSSNTYVQEADHLLFFQRDEVGSMAPRGTLASEDTARVNGCLRSYIGDATGRVIVK